MYRINCNGTDILVIEVPEDATWFNIDKNNLGNLITETLELGNKFLSCGKSSIMFGKKVDNCTYFSPKLFYCLQHIKEDLEIIGKLSTLEDKDLKKFIKFGSCIDTYHNYTTNDTYKSNQLHSIRESFKSLLKVNNINLDDDKILLIKVLK